MTQKDDDKPVNLRGTARKLRIFYFRVYFEIISNIPVTKYGQSANKFRKSQSRKFAGLQNFLL